MNLIKFKDFQLILTPTYIQFELFHESHFGLQEFHKCFKLKIEHYRSEKIGIVVKRIHPKDKYSFDPMILLSEKKTIEKHVKWVILVSDQYIDALNLKFVKIFTNVQCLHFSEYREAMQIINSNNLP